VILTVGRLKSSGQTIGIKLFAGFLDAPFAHGGDPGSPIADHVIGN
jgi:hypothetical protein